VAFWRAIDWQRPWLAPYRRVGEAVCAQLERGNSVAEALNAAADGAPPRLEAGPLRFVPHDALPRHDAYEAFIRRSACVPTRDNLHDLFNGLAWLRWPEAKRRLNELQAAEIAHAGVGATRGALRDALTLFDENAALLQAPRVLVDALARHDWHGLFIEHRAAWAEARLILFGHALIEKLVHPRKPITAHVCVLQPDTEPLRPLLAVLDAAWLAAKPFLPLPVLGVPGWWPPNESPSFYADRAVFRPPSASSPRG
jgi:hypothetical protein